MLVVKLLPYKLMYCKATIHYWNQIHMLHFFPLTPCRPGVATRGGNPSRQRRPPPSPFSAAAATGPCHGGDDPLHYEGGGRDAGTSRQRDLALRQRSYGHGCAAELRLRVCGSVAWPARQGRRGQVGRRVVELNFGSFCPDLRVAWLSAEAAAGGC
jgi:hypothetical protein